MNVTLKLFAAMTLMALSATAARAEAYIGGSIGSTAMVPASWIAMWFHATRKRQPPEG